MRVAAARGRGETAVDVDLRDEADFATFVSLLPCTISAVAYAGECLTFGMSDTGSGAGVAPDRGERAALARALDEAGVVMEDVLRLRQLHDR